MVALEDRCGNDFAIEDNRHLTAFILARDFVEKLGSLGVEFERNTIALLVEVGEGAGHILTRESGAALDEDLCALLLVLPRPVGFQHERGVHDLLAILDALHAGGTAFVHDSEFEFRYTLELGFRLIELLRIEAGDLHKNAVLALRCDDWFADSVLVDTLANDLHRLIEQIGGDASLRLRNEADQKRCAPLKIQTEPDFFIWRRDLLDTESREQEAQNQSQPAFARWQVAGEIPAEEHEKEEAEAKGQDG